MSGPGGWPRPALPARQKPLQRPMAYRRVAIEGREISEKLALYLPDTGEDYPESELLSSDRRCHQTFWRLHWLRRWREATFSHMMKLGRMQIMEHSNGSVVELRASRTPDRSPLSARRSREDSRGTTGASAPGTPLSQAAVAGPRIGVLIAHCSPSNSNPFRGTGQDSQAGRSRWRPALRQATSGQSIRYSF